MHLFYSSHVLASEKMLYVGRNWRTISLYQINERKYEEDHAPTQYPYTFFIDLQKIDWSEKMWPWIEKQNVSVPETEMPWENDIAEHIFIDKLHQWQCDLGAAQRGWMTSG